MLLPGVFSTQEQKQVSGITEESPRSPESRSRLFVGWEHASVIRQLRRQMLRVLGEGGRYLRLQPPFLPFPRLPFSDHRMNTALLPTCLRSHSPTQARLQTIHAASARPCLPGCFIIPLTLPKYYGRLRYLKKNHQQLIDTRQIPYASRCFVCCFSPACIFSHPPR